MPPHRKVPTLPPRAGDRAVAALATIRHHRAAAAAALQTTDLLEAIRRTALQAPLNDLQDLTITIAAAVTIATILRHVLSR